MYTITCHPSYSISSTHHTLPRISPPQPKHKGKYACGTDCERENVAFQGIGRCEVSILQHISDPLRDEALGEAGDNVLQTSLKVLAQGTLLVNSGQKI